MAAIIGSHWTRAVSQTSAVPVIVRLSGVERIPGSQPAEEISVTATQ
jgi:hypothetical protein